MIKQTKYKIFNVILIPLIILSFFLVLFSFYYYYNFKKNTELFEYGTAKNNSKTITHKVNKYFEKLEIITNTLVADLNTGKINYENIPKTLKKIAKKNPEIYGIAVAFEPFAFRQDKKLYSPFYFKNKLGDFRLVDISDKYDYTQKSTKKINTSWYNSVIKKGKNWIEPFYGSRSGAYLVGYGKTFHKKNNKTGKRELAGIVIVDYTLEGIRKALLSFDLDEKNSLIILAEDGKFISHPNIDYCGNKGILDLANDLNSWKLKTFASKIIKNKNSSVEIFNPQIGHSQLYFSTPVKCNEKWSVITTYDKTLTQSEKIKSKHLEILFGLSALLFITLVCFYFLVRKPHSRTVQIITITILSFSILYLISFILMTNTSADNDESINIYDQEELQNFISSSTKDITNSDVKKILYVHVGVQILSLQFTSRNTVDISGFIWQKTPIDRSNNISYDFFLPGSAGNAKIEKVFERKRNNFMTILYEFSTKLQYSDTGAQYPFDKSKIELSIWPKEFDQHTIFIPDFMAYDYLDPAMKPGIITKNITGNWEISKSYFSFVPYPLDASLGYLEYMKRHIKPYILTYNIKVKRNIWPPFISNILPCIIIAILVFMLISFFARNKEKLNDTGTVFHSLRYFGITNFCCPYAWKALYNRNWRNKLY